MGAPNAFRPPPEADGGGTWGSAVPDTEAGSDRDGQGQPAVRNAVWERAGKWVGCHRHLVATAQFFALATLAGAVKYLVDIRTHNAEIAWRQRETELRMACALAGEERLQVVWELLGQAAAAGEDDTLTSAARVGQARPGLGARVPLRTWEGVRPGATDVAQAAVSANGRQALVGWVAEQDGFAHAALWSLADLALLASREAEASAGAVRFLDAGPRANLAAPGGRGLRVVDPRGGTKTWAWSLPPVPGRSGLLTVSHGDRAVALTSRSGGADPESLIFTLDSTVPLATPASDVHAVDDVGDRAVLPDPAQTASRLLHRAHGELTPVEAQGCALFSPAGDRLACGKGGRLAVQDAASTTS